MISVVFKEVGRMLITFITGNAHKADYVARHLGTAINHQKVELPEIQELDVEKLIRTKAEAAYHQIHRPILVEDASLTIRGLGRLPGPFVKWFESEIGNEGICRLVDGLGDRRATASVIFGLYDGRTFHSFTGEATGRIAERPRGSNGFGWDPVFIHDGYELTRAEMDQETLEAISMRKQALAKLAAHLHANS
jgi:non-canonical purine NTP pyrophosphatase (RdgB/HAM1 family)